MTIALLLAALGACSGSGEPPPSATPVAVAPPSTPTVIDRAVPQPAGMGRIADVPEVPCPGTRASAPLSPDATITECRVDTDCTAGRNGRCLRVSNHGPFGPAHEATTCSYDACFQDADCGSPSSACFCGARTDTEPGMGHSCASGECATDRDCGGDRYCRRGPSGRYCHSPRDHCVEETECGAGLRCTLGPDGLYDCLPYTSPLG